jgi:hypothetical protein
VKGLKEAAFGWQVCGADQTRLGARILSFGSIACTAGKASSGKGWNDMSKFSKYIDMSS